MMNLRSIFNFSSNFQNQDEIILRDYLALERTKLANERTLLSYIRSSLYLLLGGIAIIQLNGFESIKFLGYLSLGLTIILVIIGVYRFRKLNKQLRIYYLQIESMIEKNKSWISLHNKWNWKDFLILMNFTLVTWQKTIHTNFNFRIDSITKSKPN